MPDTVDVVFERSNVSVAHLAEYSGLTIDRVLAIIEGRWTPSPHDRARIASVLGIDVDAVSWGHTMNPRNVRYRRYGLPQHLTDTSSDTDFARTG